MPLTLHTQNKMAGNLDDFYLFGEDFKAIFDILEDDEDLERSTNYDQSNIPLNA